MAAAAQAQSEITTALLGPPPSTVVKHRVGSSATMIGPGSTGMMKSMSLWPLNLHCHNCKCPAAIIPSTMSRHMLGLPFQRIRPGSPFLAYIHKLSRLSSHSPMSTTDSLSTRRQPQEMRVAPESCRRLPQESCPTTYCGALAILKNMSGVPSAQSPKRMSLPSNTCPPSARKHLLGW